MNNFWIGFYTLLRKEIYRFVRIWMQTLLPSAITMTLYFVIFGTLIGSQINAIKGFTYMQYIAPGLIMMAVITNAYNNVVASFFGARFQKSIEEMLVAPLPHALLLLGFTAGGVARGLTVGLIITGISLFFTRLHIEHPLLIIIVVLLASTLFSLAGFTNGIFAKKFDDISIVPTFVLTPLTYFGGVFYSIQDLSEPWRTLSYFNPILYMVNAFRGGILGISDVNMMHAIIIMLALTIALFCSNWYLLQKGVGIRS